MKKFIVRSGLFLSLFIVVSAPLVLSVYEYDPLRQFRWSDSHKIAYVGNAREMNPGLAMHYPDYNTILLGTSLSENTRYASVHNAFPSARFLKLTVPGSTFAEQGMSLDVAVSSNKGLRAVFWEVNSENFIRNERFHLSYKINPDLYTNSVLSKVRYMFSNYYFHWTLKTLGRESKAIEDLFYWGEGKVFSKEETLKRYDPNKTNPPFYYDKQKEMIEREIVSRVKDNPEVDFYIYLPPLSIIYYRRIFNLGEDYLDMQLKLQSDIIGELLEYENVTIFDFRSMGGVFSNLDNYKDAFHYSPKVNDNIIEYMRTGTYSIQNQRNFDVNSDGLKNEVVEFFMTNCDFSC